MTGCASPIEDEMDRAQQELDQRHYLQAIDRLETLGLNYPDSRISDRYVDLLSSSYLGASGVDLLESLGTGDIPIHSFKKIWFSRPSQVNPINQMKKT